MERIILPNETYAEVVGPMLVKFVPTNSDYQLLQDVLARKLENNTPMKLKEFNVLYKAFPHKLIETIINM